MRANRANERLRREITGKRKTWPNSAGFYVLALMFGPRGRFFGCFYFHDLFLLFGVVVFPFFVVVVFVFVDLLVGLLLFEFLVVEFVVRPVGLVVFGRVVFAFILLFRFAVVIFFE